MALRNSEEKNKEMNEGKESHPHTLIHKTADVPKESREAYSRLLQEKEGNDNILQYYLGVDQDTHNNDVKLVIHKTHNIEAGYAILLINDNGWVKIVELQIVHKLSLSSILSEMIDYLRKQYPTYLIYLCFKKSQKRKDQLCERLGGSKGILRFQDAFTSNEQDNQIIYSFPSLKKSYLCLILAGSERSGATVGIEKDVESIMNYFRKFQDVTVKRIDTPTIRAANLQEWISHLKEEGMRKIVIFYTGHGKNDNNVDFPTPDCPPIENDRKVAINLSDLAEMTKGFQMSVVGADCCNGIPLFSVMNQKGGGATDYHPFDGEGHLIFCSSKKGQVSWGSSDLGGVFLSTFFSVFSGHWTSALEQTKNLLANNCSVPQTPHWDEKNFVQRTIHNNRDTPGQLPATTQRFSFVKDIVN